MDCPECGKSWWEEKQDYSLVWETFKCECGVNLRVCYDEELIHGDAGEIEDIQALWSVEKVEIT